MASRGIIAFIVLIVLIVAVAYLEVGTNFLKAPEHTTTVSTTSATTTTIPGGGNKTSTTTVPNSTVYFCNNFYLSTLGLNSTLNGRCMTNGSTVGLWVAAGYSGKESVKIVGADKKTYVNQSSTYPCLTFFENFSAPQQVYNITLRTGTGGGSGSSSCSNAEVKLNYTTVPPPTTYSYLYNGNFSSGSYLGWTVTNPGFCGPAQGTTCAPLNISYATMHHCYLNQPWSSYVGNFFATTYTCGTAVAAGNLTSSPFYVNATKPFLNFRLISPLNKGLYFEVLYNNTARVVARYNTFNSSLGSNAVFTFVNASLPLGTLANRAVRLRVVSNVTGISNQFIAVGDFAVSSRPIQTQGILVNETIS